jgi:hypothetical protein
VGEPVGRVDQVNRDLTTDGSRVQELEPQGAPGPPQGDDPDGHKVRRRLPLR